ncbi:MAG TPA: AEC family transporter [Anaerolineales bacterium]|nr:AEC family transporter [Anaerolineales bacterium]HNE03905.1 AEC family transporter [Anaerolineales bacterium]HNF93316.1 AEC family transporter [Anaerolineales bacterium]HNM35870.1 AEC family transporter [Anaerolineales bacterium]HNO93302.1 AEC family transporter [Anaerolineales bacterium]
MSFIELFNTFANNLLPIMLIAAAGYILGKTLTVDSRTIGRMVFYIFSPLLVFNLMVTSQLNLKQALTTVGYTVAVIAIMGLLAFIFGKIFQLSRPHLLAVIITVAFGNTGNYGLPLVKFAFGDEALAVASIFYVTTTILFNTVGVVIASLGHLDLKSAILGVFKLPILYAVTIALILKGFGIAIPLPLSRTIEIAANGAIPAMIILLGLELTRIEWTQSLRATGVGVAAKLLIGPLVGLLLASLFGLQGHTRQGSVIEAAMPAAVATTVVATEYKLEPSLVTAIVFFGTILSPITLTPLIVFLTR